MKATVPARYMGVWRRTLLETSAGQDASSLVLWMQTRSRHADLRIPADRPDFSGCTRLEDCSIAQLRWLATQQGFTGITEVKGDVCRWIRDEDYQPVNGTNDIGRMAFDGDDTLLETGIEAEYFEIWKKAPARHVVVSAVQRDGVNRHGHKIAGYLLKVSNQFAFVRPRSIKLPQSADLLGLIDTLSPPREDLLDWLDFEISFGEVTAEGLYQVAHSTLPFQEGRLI